jgi:hypothetical protein
VPTCFWPSRSDSSAAMFRMRLNAALSGTSTAAESLSPRLIWDSIIPEGLRPAFLVKVLLSQPVILAE